MNALTPAILSVTAYISVDWSGNYSVVSNKSIIIVFWTIQFGLLIL